jgi:hypothetical protein
MMPSQQRLQARQILGLGQLDLNLMDELLLIGTGTDWYIRHAASLKSSGKGVQSQIIPYCRSTA